MQAKLNSRINVLFPLNKHSDLYFLSYNNSVHIIHFNLKKLKDFYQKEKRYRWKRAKKTVLWNANYDSKNNDYANPKYVHIVLNDVILRQISYDIVPYAQHFLTCQFFPKYNVNKLCSQLRQNITWTNEYRSMRD